MSQMSDDEIIQELYKFFVNPDMSSLELPPILTKEQRAKVHEVARDNFCSSKSFGKEPSRKMVLTKGEGFGDFLIPKLCLPESAVGILKKSISLKPQEAVICQYDMLSVDEPVVDYGHLLGSPAVVPPRPGNSRTRCQVGHPIWHHRDDLLNKITGHPFIMICGQTGSGKTTQVPQYIIEDACTHNRHCKVICSMPRRVAAVGVSERVAVERGETIGNTVGYVIKLESRVSSKTALTYCTNGVLIRSLLGSIKLQKVTHLIIDEVHERDKTADIIILVLKLVIRQYPNLKVILMSATMETDKFKNYFDLQAPVISVGGTSYNVEEFYLEDILKELKYFTPAMKALQSDRAATLYEQKYEEKEDDCEEREQPRANLHGSDNATVDPTITAVADDFLESIMNFGNADDFVMLLSFYKHYHISIDYQHSETGLTILMAASAVLNYGCVENLLCTYEPSLGVTCKNNKTALDYAQHNEEDISELLKSYLITNLSRSSGEDLTPTLSRDLEQNLKIEEVHNKENSQPGTSGEDQMANDTKDLERLDLYEESNLKSSELIDYYLIVQLLVHIHLNKPEGAVLIFLPGYEHIVGVKAEIESYLPQFGTEGKLEIYFLHSQMQTAEQKKAFVPAPSGVRKIILSTNIAETSITITDIKYVLDTGIFKEKSFDPQNGVHSLQCEWVSKASAKQRKGRAGRVQNGTCYRLYSRSKYEEMIEHQIPEMLREPLHEDCLIITQLVPSGMKTAEFLSMAIDPPKQETVASAIQILQTMKAIDNNEQLTPLGRQMIKLPLEPQCSKIILCGLMLQCLEPALILACCISQGDLFKMPVGYEMKKKVATCKKQFADKRYSDELIYIRVFEGLYKATARKYSQPFEYCFNNYISYDNINGIIQMKEQIRHILINNGWIKDDSSLENHNSKQWAVVKAALTYGLYPNVAQINLYSRKMRTRYLSNVIVHPKSVLVKKFKKNSDEAVPSSWMVYGELLKVGNIACLCENTLVSPLTVCLFTGSTPKNDSEHIVVKDGEKDHLTCVPADTEVKLHFDPWVVIRTDIELSVLIKDLRVKWDALVEKCLLDPRRALTKDEKTIRQTVVDILVEQDKILGLDEQLAVKAVLPFTRNHQKSSGRRKGSNR